MRVSALASACRKPDLRTSGQIYPPGVDFSGGVRVRFPAKKFYGTVLPPKT